MLSAATVDRGFAGPARAARQDRHARLCSLAAFLRRPEALDLSHADLAARFSLTEGDVERSWGRHFARLDAQAREARLDRSGPVPEPAPGPVVGPSPGSAESDDRSGGFNRPDAEVAALLAVRARPEHPDGRPNTGERDFEVDLPDVHGWWAVPDSRTPAERARAAALPRRERASLPAPRPDLRRACRLLVAEWRQVRRRHRRTD